MTKKWLETRRSYLDKLKSQVELMSGLEDPSITDYSFSNKVLYKQVWSCSDEDAFVERVLESSLVLCGDFHSSSFVKRFYIRFFENFVKKTNRPLFMALECFDYDQQENLELWLRGSLSEDLFLEKSEWKKKWGFNWSSYKDLLIELYKLGVNLKCANNQEQDLDLRDEKIAQTLMSFIKNKPNEPKDEFSGLLNEPKDESSGLLNEPKDESNKPIVFCMIGQHHLGPENLVKKVNRDLNCLCLHLDPEDLYFDVGHFTLLEDTFVLNYDNHFAFFSSPPWVHWQNHLMFLEEYLDIHEEEHDYHSDLNRSRDYDLVVYDYTKLLCKDLGIDAEALKRVEVSSIDEYQVQGDFNDEQLYKTLEPFLDSETSFYWPEQKEGIMVVSSLNHGASVAGRILHAQMMGVEKFPWGDPSSFKVWSWLEAIGYFLSKFINPKRKPVAAHNLGAFLKARLGEESSKKIMTFLVKNRVKEIKGELQTHEAHNTHKAHNTHEAHNTHKAHKEELMEWQELVYASRLKGSLVGECLFKLYLKGQFEVETIKTYMSLPVTDKSRFEPLYDFVVERLNLSLHP